MHAVFWRAGGRAFYNNYFSSSLLYSEMVWNLFRRESTCFSKRYLRVYFGIFINLDTYSSCHRVIFDQKISNFTERSQGKLVSIFSKKTWIFFGSSFKTSLNNTESKKNNYFGVRAGARAINSHSLTC